MLQGEYDVITYTIIKGGQKADVAENLCDFLGKFLEDTSPFLGPLIPPRLDLW